MRQTRYYGIVWWRPGRRGGGGGCFWRVLFILALVQARDGACGEAMGSNRDFISILYVFHILLLNGLYQENTPSTGQNTWYVYGTVGHDCFVARRCGDFKWD